MPKSTAGWLKAVALLIVVALVLIGIANRQAIGDWVRLLGYQPPATISKIANQDTMTAEARHLFYINKPALEDKANFSQDCPNGSEKTIVLGCYKGDESGIYILKVDDPRLNGIEQVTAAHEMLHAAYDRLSSGEKQKVDGWLMSYYKTLKNQRLLNIFNAYKRSEPGQVIDEMHSIFGTEVADLPPNLTNYYKQYFNDRLKVTSYAASYQSTFVNLKNQLASYDAQLKSLKSDISNDEATASSLVATLRSERNQLNIYQAGGDTQAYNGSVPEYNDNVDRYNQLARAIDSEINNYNQIVENRNKLAVTINDLGQELNAGVKPVSTAGQ